MKKIMIVCSCQTDLSQLIFLLNRFYRTENIKFRRTCNFLLRVTDYKSQIDQHSKCEKYF